MYNSHVYDFIAVGAGPSNLSLAALARNTKLTDGKAPSFLVLDKKKRFSWHAGQHFDNATMQSSFLRDLVTTVDPTNEFSFLNYLNHKGRLMSFLNRGTLFPSRLEFEDYLSWVSSSIEQIQWQQNVTEILVDSDRAAWTLNVSNVGKKRIVYAKDLVVATGWLPCFGKINVSTSSDKFLHISDYKTKTTNPSVRGKIAIVGAGQSAGELILELLENSGKCQEIFWFDRNPSPKMLNTSNFVRDYYSSEFSQRFFDLPAAQKEKINTLDAAAGIGLSPNILDAIYNTLYEKRWKNEAPHLRFRQLCNVYSVSDAQGRIKVKYSENGVAKSEIFDQVVAATGYVANTDLLNTLLIDTKLALRKDYSVKNLRTGGPRVFFIGSNYSDFGLADGNLSSMPGRAQIVLESMGILQTGQTIQQLPMWGAE